MTRLMQQIGFTPYFRDRFDDIAQKNEELIPARVSVAQREQWQVLTGRGPLRASLSGRWRYHHVERPVVGDWVALQSQGSVIRSILPRKSCLVRKRAGDTSASQVVAANVDTVLIVCGLGGELNLRRLERYLAFAWESGASPVVVLNKVDLCREPQRPREEVEAIACGVPVHLISARRGEGLEALDGYLGIGRTLALVGSSGVGKSTLTNRLLGYERQAVQVIRQRDSKGRHTTTARELFVLPGGATLIDTPGMRELGLWQDDGSLASGFADIEELQARCRFRDCSHQCEPGCALIAAVEAGELAEERLQSYHKLQRELAYLARRQDRRLAQEERARRARLTRSYRRRPDKRQGFQ